MRGGHWPFAVLNVVLSVSGALIALWAGQSLARA